MTYGSQQAVTAEALCELLRSDWHTADIEIPTVVWLRDQMRLALLERLQIVRGRYAPVKDTEPHLDQIANNAHEVLPVIMGKHHRGTPVDEPADESRLSLSVTRRATQRSRPGDVPRRAITIANHDLDQGDDQPWLRRHGPHWQLIEDAATAIEAFLVLDDRLKMMGALRSHTLPDRRVTLRGARTLTSGIAREAAWVSDTGADLVAARPARGPVQVIHGPDDLIVGHQRLAGMLEPGSAGRGHYRRAIDVRLARVVALAQAEENRLLALAATELGEDCLAAEVPAEGRAVRRVPQRIPARPPRIRGPGLEIAGVPAARVAARHSDAGAGPTWTATTLRSWTPCTTRPLARSDELSAST